MIMQMGAEFKKEQIGTLVCLVGALEVGFGGWVVPHRCLPQKNACLPKKLLVCPLFFKCAILFLTYILSVMCEAKQQAGKNMCLAMPI